MTPDPTYVPALDPDAMAVIVIVVGLIVIILTILWILLPFAVFGIKRRLDQALSLQRQQLYLLDDAAKSLAVLASEVQQGLQAPPSIRPGLRPPT